MTEEQLKLRSYIESEKIGKGMENYNRTSERKAVRYYLMSYMKYRLGMNYREIAEMLGFYNKHGEGDHATSIHGVRQWGQFGSEDDFKAYTRDVQFLFPMLGKSGFTADMPSRILKSLGSLCEQMHIQSLGDGDLVTLDMASELMRVSIPTFRVFAKKNKIKLKKVIDKRHYYSKYDIIKHAGL